MVELDNKRWATIALVATMIGYITPVLHVAFAPILHIYWGYSLVIVFVGSMSGDTYIILLVLLMVPFVFAVVGWMGYVGSENVWHLRLVFFPSFIMGVAIVIFAINSALLGEVFLPLNSVAFFVAAYAAYRARILG